MADWEQIANAEIYSDIKIKRFKAEEFTVTNLRGHSYFSLAGGDPTQPGAVRSISDPNRRWRGRPKKDPTQGATIAGGEDSDGPPGLDPESDDEDAGNSGQARGKSEQAEGDVELDNKNDSEMGDVKKADFFIFNGEVLVRHHIAPRMALFDNPNMISQIFR